MADLHPNDTRVLEAFFGMGSGYVLDFSDRTFHEFVEATCQRNIDEQRYLQKGRSKASRLRQFWKAEPPDIVAKLIRALVEYTDFSSQPHTPSPEQKMACLRIANRLMQGTPIDRAPLTETPEDMPEIIPEEYSKHLLRRGFELVELLGSGLSGRVFRAHQRPLDRPVAVKFFDNLVSVRNEGLRTRFVREASLLARIESRFVPFVVTCGEVPGTPAVPYFIMQFISGTSLDRALRSERPSRKTTIERLKHVLHALAAAHDKKIIHRDVCPQNIIVDAEGKCWLIDFSIGVSLDTTSSQRATQTGDRLGRPNYIAPELTKGARDCTPASDVYSMGALFREMLCGHPAAVLPPDLADFTELLNAACATEPAERFQNARAFLNALEHLAPEGYAIPKTPSMALCTQLLCEEANWSPRGYYRGPRIIEECTDSFCDACGSQLISSCSGCGGDLTPRPFCGRCGQRWFEVPTCPTCGSFLKRADLQAPSDHCSRCERDIPF